MTSPPLLPPPPPFSDPSSGNSPDAGPYPLPLPPPPPQADAPVPNTAFGETTPQDKSVGVAFALTFFFGTLGLFYVIPAGQAILVNIGAVILAVVTIGFGLFLIIPGAIVWACIAASNQHTAYETWRTRTMMGR